MVAPLHVELHLPELVGDLHPLVDDRSQSDRVAEQMRHSVGEQAVVLADRRAKQARNADLRGADAELVTEDDASRWGGCRGDRVALIVLRIDAIWICS